MTDEVNGYDDGYRQMQVPEPRRMSEAYLRGYAGGVRDRLRVLENPAMAEPKDEDFLERIQALAARVKLGMNCKVIVGRDEEIPNGRYYLQIECIRMDVITKKMGPGYGGKAYLSPHMTDSELFQIMFGLYKGYWEHEARENFEIDGLRPFGPHISTEALLTVARKVDVRSAKHVEDTKPRHGHIPVQHRDGKEPWCNECGRTADFREPQSRFEDLARRVERHAQVYPGTSLDI